jgi:hypothetical protein
MSYGDEDLAYVPRATGPGLGDPAALATASVVLATLSLGGFGLLNGSTYVSPFIGDTASVARTVLGGLLGALFALAPVVLGLLAHRRTHPGDPSWVPRLAQAGVLLGGISIVLRLVATAVASISTDGRLGPLL